jgi:hypothetical protein
MINERSGEIIFRTSFVQVPKIHTYMDGSLLLIHGNGIGHPFNQGNRVDEANVEQLLHLCLNSRGPPSIYSSKYLSNRFRIQIHFNFVLNYTGVDP